MVKQIKKNNSFFNHYGYIGYLLLPGMLADTLFRRFGWKYSNFAVSVISILFAVIYGMFGNLTTFPGYICLMISLGNGVIGLFLAGISVQDHIQTKASKT